MPQNKQFRRSASETLWIHLLMHIGFSNPLLAEVPLRSNALSFGKRSIERASELMEIKLAHKEYNWPTKPNSRTPGISIRSTDQLVEMSILASCMVNLYDEKVYEGLVMQEVINAYDLYTNIRGYCDNTFRQITPNNAYWMAREFHNHYATIPYCEKCSIHYYSSIEQKISNGCPICKRMGIGENNGVFTEDTVREIKFAKSRKQYQYHQSLN